MTAEYTVSLPDEQVRVLLREDRRDETAMKKRLLIKLRKYEGIDVKIHLDNLQKCNFHALTRWWLCSVLIRTHTAILTVTYLYFCV